MRRVPINPTQEVADNPIAALATGLPGGIERQESDGQRQFVASKVLPTDMREGTREALERAGFVFTGPVGGDPIFQHVTMPEGWAKRGTDHSMWSELIDPKGRVRGMIFYKAAFYDRSSHMRLNCRYSVEKNYDVKDSVVYRIEAGDDIVHVMPEIPMDKVAPWGSDEAARAAAYAWMDENYPDHKDPLAYWD